MVGSQENKGSHDRPCFTRSNGRGVTCLVKNGDLISIDIKQGKLDLVISRSEIEERKKMEANKA